MVFAFALDLVLALALTFAVFFLALGLLVEVFFLPGLLAVFDLLVCFGLFESLAATVFFALVFLAGLDDFEGAGGGFNSMLDR